MNALEYLKQNKVKIITEFFKYECDGWLNDYKTKRILNDYKKIQPYKMSSLKTEWADYFRREIIGFNNGIDWIIEKLETKNKKKLNIEEIIELNKKVGYRQFINFKKMRSCLIEITNTSYITDVPNHVKNKKMYEKFLKGKRNVRKIIKFYTDFIYEQFFNNGNKRTALLIANFFLIKYHNALLLEFDTERFYTLLGDFFEKKNQGREKLFIFMSSNIKFFNKEK